MGKRSSIERLDPKIRSAADAAIKRGATIEEVVDLLDGLGADISRSAVGRYSLKYRAIIDQQREIDIISKNWAAEFNTAEDETAKLMLQLLHTVITKNVMELASDGKRMKNMTSLDAKNLAQAGQALMGARQTLQKVIEKAQNQAFQQAAEAVEEVGKTAGASPETINMIRARILGMKTV